MDADQSQSRYWPSAYRTNRALVPKQHPRSQRPVETTEQSRNPSRKTGSEIFLEKSETRQSLDRVSVSEEEANKSVSTEDQECDRAVASRKEREKSSQVVENQTPDDVVWTPQRGLKSEESTGVEENVRDPSHWLNQSSEETIQVHRGDETSYVVHSWSSMSRLKVRVRRGFSTSMGVKNLPHAAGSW